MIANLTALFLLVFLSFPSFSQTFFSPNPSVSIEMGKINSFLVPILEIEIKANHYNLSKPVLQTILIVQSNAGKSIADGKFNYGRVVTSDQMKRFEAFSNAKNGFVECSTRSRGIEAISLSLHFLRAGEKKALTDAQWLTLVFGPKGDLSSLANQANDVYKVLTEKNFKDLGLSFGTVTAAPQPKITIEEKPQPKVEAITETSAKPIEKPDEVEAPKEIHKQESPERPSLVTTAIQIQQPAEPPKETTQQETQQEPPAKVVDSQDQKPQREEDAPTAPISPLQQEAIKLPVQKSGYARSSFAIIQTNQPGSGQPFFRNATRGKSHLASRFDWNYTSTYQITIDSTSRYNAKKLTAQLESLGIGRELLAFWFERGQDGKLGINRIATRGQYNATDLEKKLSQSSPRDVAELRDAGINLIDNSYVLLVETNSFITMEQHYDQLDANQKEFVRKNPSNKYEPVARTKRGYRGQVTGYLFKINYNDTVRQALYAIWPGEKDIPVVLQQKIHDFEKLQVPLTFIREISPFPIEVSVEKEKPKDPKAEGIQIDLYQEIANASKEMRGLHTEEDFVRKFEQKTLEKFFNSIKQRASNGSAPVAGLSISASLFNDSPIQVKIGLKEGVYPEKRFFVYEKQQKSSGAMVYRRKGIIRAKSPVTDNKQNTDGNTLPTRFIRVGGMANLEEGMLVREKTELGWSLAAFYAPGIVGNKVKDVGGGIEWNASLFLGKVWPQGAPSGLKIGVGLTLQNGDDEDEQRKFHHLWLHVKKDWPLASVFRFALFTGYAYDWSSNDKNENNASYSAGFIPAGTELGLNIFPGLQAFTQAEYGIALGKAKLRDENRTSSGRTWYDIYSDRKGVTGRAGLRLSF